MKLGRVFALVPDCHTAGRYMRVWRRHFYDGLVGALPSVVLPVDVDFSWARPAPAALPRATPERDAVSARLWDQIKLANAERMLDAVISYCFTADIDPALIDRTVQAGIPWINFYCDSTYAFDRVEALARVTSLNWFPEHEAIPSYRATGRPLVCRPYAVNPAGLPEAVCERARYSSGFVGAPTGNRVLRLGELFFLGVPVAVRGEGWRSVRRASPAPPAKDRRMRARLVERVLMRAFKPLVGKNSKALTDAEMTEFLSQCRVVFGLNEGRNLRGEYSTYLKLRDIEFPGYGCCYLTQHNHDVEQAFEIGKEVLTFRSVAEAAAIVRWSKRRPDDARRIGAAGRRRVLEEHTWSARLPELAQAL